ncbi:hypothetical protein Tco_0701027 [Tanacetum coccineum]
MIHDIAAIENSGTESKNSSLETTFSRSENEHKSFNKESSNSEGNDADADIGPSYDNDTMNENNSNIISDIPNMDPDRDKEEHDYVNYEQQYAFFASLINNLKCEVDKSCEKDKTFAKENEKYDEYVQPLLKRKNELEKKNQEFLKQIKDLDNRLQKAGQADQTLRMLLPKEDNVNTGKQRLGFENQNNDVNPSLLNKAK